MWPAMNTAAACASSLTNIWASEPSPVGRAMLRVLFIRTVGKLIGWPVRRRLWAFYRDCENPQTVQEELLRRIIARQSATQFGRDHGFGGIRSVADFRRCVPVAPYEYVQPYIERVQNGDSRALLADDTVHMFALTSGTTAARKFIPVTSRYLDHYRRGWNLWGLKAMRDHRDVTLRPIVQIVGDPEEFRTEAGIPCGSISGFTAQVQWRIIRRLYCVPACTGRIKDATARSYVALLFALPRNAGMVLAANPSSLVMLARIADQHKENLIRDLADGTLRHDLDISDTIRSQIERRLGRRPKKARQFEDIVRRSGALYPKDIWPPEHLLIGTWTGGSVGPYLRQLNRYYGETCLRDLGLVASEGRFTIPMQDGCASGVLDIGSHYFEFVPEEEAESKQPTVLGAHELVEGRHYFILPTTDYGLYRYDIRDLVKVTGFFGCTPLLQFLGKGNHFANLTGEKLSEHHVTRAMDEVARRRGVGPGTYSLAPCWDDMQPFYGLFVEQGDPLEFEAPDEFLLEIDAAVRRYNTEYDSKRESNRLGGVRLMILPAGFWQRWDSERLTRSGGVPEQYKHPCLLGDVDFRNHAKVLREICAAGRR
jgi:GH3 auxin-responsive promoter